MSQIKEEKKPPETQASPPPPLSVVPGGFLKQLVRDSEKETKLKEPEVKEERAPSKLSDNLVQQFLLEDQTPPILEAEMLLRAQQLAEIAGERDNAAQSIRRILSPRPPVTHELQNGQSKEQEVTLKPPKQQQQKTQQEVRSEMDSKANGKKTVEERKATTPVEVEKPKTLVEVKKPKVLAEVEKPKAVIGVEKQRASTEVEKKRAMAEVEKKRTQTEVEKKKVLVEVEKKRTPIDLEKKRTPIELEKRIEVVKTEKQVDVMAERQDPEGRQAESNVTETLQKEVKDVWYETGTVWYVHKDGVTLATQLKPDVGTPELPEGLVRVRLQSDGSLHDVTEYEIEKCNPSELGLCEDLSELQYVNESGVLHTLTSRAQASLPLTQAGPNLISLWPPSHPHSKMPKSRRGECVWEAPPALAALVKRMYVSLVGTRRDHSVCALGRSGTGKTTACQAFTHALLKQAGTAGGSVTVERVQAVFSILRSFGCVSSPHSDASSRFATVLSLDFNNAGLIAGGHLQTMMLDKWKVCQKTEGESNFLVFAQMMAGLSTEMRTELQLHQIPEFNSFGIVPPTKVGVLRGQVEEKQRASVAFNKLVVAMETLGITAGEQKAIWHVLAAIYHIGAAGACKVGRRQFVNFESAQAAGSVLGSEGDDLHTAVFKHHLRQLLQRATGGSRERLPAAETEDGPRLTAAQCVDGMASGLYEELFTTIVSLINRALSTRQLTLASVAVVDTPGLRNPRHAGEERAAGWAELCHNYLQERLLEHYHTHTFTHALERYEQERLGVQFESPESSPAEVVSAVDQPTLQVRAAEGVPRGLLWLLDEEMVTPGSSENAALERVCQYYSNTVRQCEQPLQCEVNHMLGLDPVRYDLTGWFALIQNNPSALNAATLLQNSTVGVVKALFSPRSSVPPLCRGLGGFEGSSQRSLQRSGTIRKTFSGGMAAMRRHSASIAVKLQATGLAPIPFRALFGLNWKAGPVPKEKEKDALLNLIRRARPVFLQCVKAKTDAGVFDIRALRVQLHSAQILPALQLYRTGYPEHMLLGDFRCRFQALSPVIVKRYASVFVAHDERKAVEELLVELDLDKKSIVLGPCRVLMRRGVLQSLERLRDQLVSGWLLHFQASCMGHLARQKYRRLKVQQMAVSCVQRNLRAMRAVSRWCWWKLFCRVRPLLNVNMDNQRLRAKEDELSVLRRKLEKSEKERNDLRQTTDCLETKVTAVTCELSDERFRGDAVGQALDVERAERMRLCKENKELQTRLDQCKVAMETLEKQLEEEQQKIHVTTSPARPATDKELVVQLECSQTEVEFVRRRLKQTEEKLEVERQARQQLDTKVSSLQAQLEQSRRSAAELKRQCRRVTSDLQDARVLTDSLQSRVHELDRKQRRFDSELTQALEQAENEREMKDKVTQENTAMGGQIYTLRANLQESQAEVSRLGQQKEELCSQVRDLSLPLDLAADSVPDLKKQLRLLEGQASEGQEEISTLTGRIQQQQQVHMRSELEIERMRQMHQKELEDKEEELEDVHKSSQRRLRQMEMQLEQEYEEKQMVVHEKHDLEGLIATLCDQVGHRDFDVEKKLRRDLKRTHALLVDAQLLLSTVDAPQGQPCSREHIERLHCQLEESEARKSEVEGFQKTLSQELDNAQIELEQLCKHKSLADEQLMLLEHEKTDLLKRLEEDQEDLNELMKKHKALIAQSSSDISQIRELQAELEEVKKQRQTLQEELQSSVSRVQFLESSTVGRSIVSKQEARVCDLENKLEFHRGQVKRFEVLVLRLRDSVVRLGEELEQSAQTEARERENCVYYQHRLHDMRLEMEDLTQREQDSSRQRMELEMQVEELTAVRQTLQADLETSIRRIVDLQAALEEVESSDDSDSESTHTATESLSRRKDLDSLSSVGTEEVGEGIRTWLGVPRGSSRAGSSRGGSPYGSQAGRQSVTDTMSTYSFRSCVDEDGGSVAGGAGTGGLGRASSSSALSELLDGLRKRHGGGGAGGSVSGGGDPGDRAGSAASLPIYQTTGASSLRRRASALSPGPEDPREARPGILKPPSPRLQRASSSASVGGASTSSSSAASRPFRYNVAAPADPSSPNAALLPTLPHLSSLSALHGRHQPRSLSIPEEELEEGRGGGGSGGPSPQRSPQAPARRRLLAGSGGGSVVASEDGGEGSLGSEPMVFQNRCLMADGGRDGAGSDILPAIRRAQSAGSIRGGGGGGGGGRRALSVHFGELPLSSRSRKSSETSESSSSGGSSAGGSQTGAGGSRGRPGGGRPQGERLEAEGSEGEDVASVMKKYLKKEVD